jgi:hypothetical protein
MLITEMRQPSEFNKSIFSWFIRHASMYTPMLTCCQKNKKRRPVSYNDLQLPISEQQRERSLHGEMNIIEFNRRK